mgnify:CR=1 FL=1
MWGGGGGAVESGQKQGEGFGVVRGDRRLEREFFPQDLVPQIRAYDAALTYELELLSKAVDVPHHEATFVDFSSLNPGTRLSPVFDHDTFTFSAMAKLGHMTVASVFPAAARQPALHHAVHLSLPVPGALVLVFAPPGRPRRCTTRTRWPAAVAATRPP